MTDDYRGELEQAQAQGRSASDPADTAAVYEQVRAATRRALQRYRELDAPDSADEALSAVIEQLDEQVQALDGVLQAAENNDTTAVRARLSDYALAIGEWQQAHSRVGAALEGGPARAGP